MTNVYGHFADLYDSLMTEFDYKAWADYYLKLMEHAGVYKDSKKLSLCDAACGTASMGLEFAALGHKVIGVDRSADMLRTASEKVRRRGFQVPLIEQDIRALELHKPVDAVVCACDGVNYLLSDEDVMAFFKAANRALRRDGGLFFDISSAYKLSRHIGNKFFGEERGDMAYLWQNVYDAQKTLLKMNITFFTRQESGLYKRFDEIHVQRAHRITGIKKMLCDCGFEPAGVYGDQTFSSPEKNELRIHFAAVKRQT